MKTKGGLCERGIIAGDADARWFVSPGQNKRQKVLSWGRGRHPPAPSQAAAGRVRGWFRCHSDILPLILLTTARILSRLSLPPQSRRI